MRVFARRNLSSFVQKTVRDDPWYQFPTVNIRSRIP